MRNPRTATAGLTLLLLVSCVSGTACLGPRLGPEATKWSDQDSLKKWIADVVPDGTFVAEARKRMTVEGYNCLLDPETGDLHCIKRESESVSDAHSYTIIFETQDEVVIGLKDTRTVGVQK